MNSRGPLELEEAGGGVEGWTAGGDGAGVDRDGEVGVGGWEMGAGCSVGGGRMEDRAEWRVEVQQEGCWHRIGVCSLVGMNSW